MNIINRSIGVALAGAILLQMGTVSVYAEDSARLLDVESVTASQEFVNCEIVLKNSAEVFDIEADLTNAYVGTPFMMYCIDDVANCALCEDTMYYPVYAEEKIVAIILVYDDGENLNYSCGKYFADELQAYSELNETYALVGDAEGNLFAVNHVDEPVLLGSDIGDEEATLDDEVKVELNISDSVICEEVADIEMMQTMGARAVTGPFHLNNYPLCQQTGDNCWAYTLFSMAKFFGKYVAIEQVYGAYYRAMGKEYVIDNGASIDEVYRTAQEIFNDHTCRSLGTYMRLAEIKYSIDRGLPACMGGAKFDGSGSAHMVALEGYQLFSDHVAGFFYMNPQTASVKYSSHTKDAQAYFYGLTGTDRYTWIETVTLY